MGHRGKLAGRLAAILLVALMIASALHPVKAHLDEPGNPAIRVKIYVDSITLKTDQDDGLDGNAEIIVKFTYLHEGHKGGGGIVSIDDFNWDYEKTRTIDKMIYDHIECSPLNEIRVSMEAIEDDTSTITTIMGGLVAIAGGIVATAYSTGTALIWAGVGGLGGITALFASINSADDLGRDTESTTTPGDLLLETNDIIVEFRIETTTVPSISCEEPKPTPTTTTTTTTTTVTETLPPGTTTVAEEIPNSTKETLKLAKRSLNERISEGEKYFEELRKILDAISELSPEPGNPGGLTSKELDYLHNELPKLILESTIDQWITIIVKTGTDVSNASQTSIEAMKHLYTARDLVARGMYMESVDHYELAWKKSLEAMFAGNQPVYLGGKGSLEINVVNDKREPIKDVRVGIYKDGELIDSYISSGGTYEKTLDKGNYTITAHTRLLWMNLQLANLPITVQDRTKATLIVSESLLPVKYITVVGDATFAILIGAIVSAGIGATAGSGARIRRTPYSVGIGLAAAVIVYLIIML